MEIAILTTLIVFFLGFCFDGQYIKDPLINALQEKLLSQEVYGAGSIFRIPVNFDAAHFLNLAVVDVREGKQTFQESSKHFKRFVERAIVYADEMKHGKGYAIMEKVAEENNLPKFAPVSFAAQG